VPIVTFDGRTDGFGIAQSHGITQRCSTKKYPVSVNLKKVVRHICQLSQDSLDNMSA